MGVLGGMCLYRGLYLQWPVLVLTVLYYYSLIWFHKLMTNLLISGTMH